MHKHTTPHVRTAAAWFCALLLFFPIFWLALMAFKTEAQAISTPPLLFFSPTLQSFRDVMARDHYAGYAINSLLTSVLSTAVGLAIALPAAYSMAFFPTRGTVGLLKFILSSRYMPGVGALMPIYICYQYFGLLDSRAGLTFMFMLMNLPIMIWLLYTNLRELPREILEAARMDGANGWQTTFKVKLPMVMNVIVVTLLMRLIDAFRVLEVIYILTFGGPGDSTEILSLHIYKTAFVGQQLGSAAAISVLLLAVVAGLSCLALRLSNPLAEEHP